MLIYILEDDDDIREVESYALKTSGFETMEFTCAKEFYRAIEVKIPDLILLDIMLPDEDGMSVLHNIRERQATASVPVIMVTAKTTEIDRVKGLDAGADDYLCKPFGVMELVSRVRARLRGHDKKENITYQNGNILLSDDTRTVISNGNQVELTYKEFELLKLLMSHLGKVYTRSFIMDTVWGYDYEGQGRTLDMHIKTLRQKLGENGHAIKTIRNVGYKMDKIKIPGEKDGTKNNS